MAINSYRQTGGGGYDMLRGAPVVYDKGERIAELLIDAVRARSPLDSGAVAGARAGASCPRWPTGPCAGCSASRRRRCPRPRATPCCSASSPPATCTARFLPGAGALAAALDSLGEDCGCPQLRLDAGDAMQGTPVQDETRGRAGMELLGRLGYAAAALGDHDFDWSLDVLRQRMGESRLSVARGQRAWTASPAGGRTGSRRTGCWTSAGCRWR